MPIGKQPADGEVLHKSAVDRRNLAECHYHPENLETFLARSGPVTPAMHDPRSDRNTVSTVAVTRGRCSMHKDILGDWGSDLGDADYASALAALGVLEFRGARQHRPSSDRAQLTLALKEEFAAGERTPIWRNAYRNVSKLANWRLTVHSDAAALAAAWRQYVRDLRGNMPNSRRLPRLAVTLDWHRRVNLFDFEALCAWLKLPAVGLDALVLAELPADRRGPVAWHWPLRVGVPAGAEQADIQAAVRSAQAEAWWIRRLCESYAVGAGRDACDLLILTPTGTQELLDRTQRAFARASSFAWMIRRRRSRWWARVISYCAIDCAPQAWPWSAASTR